MKGGGDGKTRDGLRDRTRQSQVRGNEREGLATGMKQRKRKWDKERAEWKTQNCFRQDDTLLSAQTEPRKQRSQWQFSSKSQPANSHCTDQLTGHDMAVHTGTPGRVRPVTIGIKFIQTRQRVLNNFNKREKLLCAILLWIRRKACKYSAADGWKMQSVCSASSVWYHSSLSQD